MGFVNSPNKILNEVRMAPPFKIVVANQWLYTIKLFDLHDVTVLGGGDSRERSCAKMKPTHGKEKQLYDLKRWKDAARLYVFRSISLICIACVYTFVRVSFECEPAKQPIHITVITSWLVEWCSLLFVFNAIMWVSFFISRKLLSTPFQSLSSALSVNIGARIVIFSERVKACIFHGMFCLMTLCAQYWLMKTLWKRLQQSRWKHYFREIPANIFRKWSN